MDLVTNERIQILLLKAGSAVIFKIANGQYVVLTTNEHKAIVVTPISLFLKIKKKSAAALQYLC